MLFVSGQWCGCPEGDEDSPQPLVWSRRRASRKLRAGGSPLILLHLETRRRREGGDVSYQAKRRTMHHPGSGTCMRRTQCTLFSGVFYFQQKPSLLLAWWRCPEDSEAAAELRAQMTSPVNVAGNASKKEATVQLQPLPERTWTEKLGEKQKSQTDWSKLATFPGCLMVTDALLHPCSEEPPGVHIYGARSSNTSRFWSKKLNHLNHL